MFETHKLNEAGLSAVKEFKTDLSMSISKALKKIPEGREKAIFKTKIEEAVFFGTKAIAANPRFHSEMIDYPECDPYGPAENS